MKCNGIRDIEAMKTRIPQAPSRLLAACLWFMTPEALRYYLPAYLKIALIDYLNSNAIPDTLINMLLQSALNSQSRIGESLNGLELNQRVAWMELAESGLLALKYNHAGDWGPVNLLEQAYFVR